MKKLLIFMCLFSLLRAESIYTRIAQESADKVFKTQIEEPKEIKKDIKINLGYSINTYHYSEFDENKNDFEFYEKNNVCALELEENKKIKGVTIFKNSFGNETIGVYIGKIKDNNNKRLYGIYRVGILSGYHKIDSLKSLSDKRLTYEFRNPTVFYGNLSVMGEIGIGYKFNDTFAIESNILGNAIVTSVKLSY